jgi:hypothetical protein
MVMLILLAFVMQKKEKKTLRHDFHDFFGNDVSFSFVKETCLQCKAPSSHIRFTYLRVEGFINHIPRYVVLDGKSRID